MSTSVMGQIGEYRELDHEERHDYLMRLLESGRNETRTIQEAGTKAIREMFNEALSCLEDGACWLERINEQFDKQYPDDIDRHDPTLPFWSEIYVVIKPLGRMIQGLEAVAKYVPRVEPLAPKEATPKSDALLTLVTAIGRHEPMANDPDVIDAINAIEQELIQMVGEEA